MKFLKTIRAWWRGLFRKRRFNMLNATDNTEEWHMHLSPASILAGLVAFMLMLFILTLSLVAYSPILEFLPGYRTEADRSRESLVQNIIRLELDGAHDERHADLQREHSPDHGGTHARGARARLVGTRRASARCW